MHDKLVYPGEPAPTIKACIMHPSVPSVFTCERPGNEERIRVTYGMCMSCATQLEVNVWYIKVINKEIDGRLMDVQGGK